MAIATFAAGCFWGVEANFSRVQGVINTTVGYVGGSTENPTYEQVCTGATGHAEAIQIDYDPQQVAYEELLEIFWTIHDPTQLNRQGFDVGRQYRSAIFVHDAAQQQAAQKSKEALNKSGKFSGKIVTEIVPIARFYKAEDYHQHYLEKRHKK